MKRPAATWLIFGTCLLAATLAVAWLSHHTQVVERAAYQTLRDADLEERIRAALWQMDSVAVPLVAIESTRPSFVDPIKDSPTLTPRLLKGYVRRDASGQWTLRRSAFKADSEPLGEESVLVSVADWWRSLPAPEARMSEALDEAQTQTVDANSSLIVWPNSIAADSNHERMQGSSFSNSASQNQNLANSQFGQEAQSRARLKQQVTDVANLGQQGGNTLRTAKPLAGRRTLGELVPVWVEGELILARRVKSLPTGEEFVEGCWLNWPAWDEVLRAQIADLVPGATLEPLTLSGDRGGDRELVALPVRIDLSAMIDEELEIGLRAKGMAIVQAMLALTAAAVGWLLWQTLGLSERRAAFVSAVTHELRTPLTTFRLYTEMLSDGLVTDPEQQQSYYRTLHREANRLMHLVENVLAYARLEKGRPTNRTEDVSLGELLDRCWPRLLLRVAESPLRLESQIAEPTRATRLKMNAIAVEQVLFNLIDNACKYASNATDLRIVLDAEVTTSVLTIRVSDFGPGLSKAARRTLFEPFGKSSAQSAETAPGIGLGLTLARRLARDLGGELRCDQRDEVGLVFVLSLPCG